MYRRLGALIVVGGLVASTVILAIVTSGPAPVVQPPSVPRFGGDPLPGGDRMSLADARDSTPWAMYVPDTALLPQDDISSVWLREGEDPELLVEYRTGFTVTIRPLDDGAADEEWYRRQVAEGVPGAIHRLDGVTMFSVPASEEGDRGSVTFEWDGLRIAIVGNGMTVEHDLLETARAMLDTDTS